MNCRGRRRCLPVSVLLSTALVAAITTVITIALGALAGRASAAPPVITSTVPEHFVVDETLSGHVHELLVEGSDLVLPTTNGFTFPTDVTAFAKAGPDDGWHQATNATPWFRWSGGHSSDQLDFAFIDVSQVGAITIAICVRTAGCAVHEIPVLAHGPATFVGPTIRVPMMPAPVMPLNPSTFFNVVATGLNDTSRLFVGPVEAVDFEPKPDYDWGTFYVPTIVQATPGASLMFLTSDGGDSTNFGRLEVWTPPALATPVPVLTTLPATVTLTFRDPFGVPEALDAAYSVPKCPDQFVMLTPMSDHTYSVRIPGACASATSTYTGTLHLRNFVGNTDVAIPVQPRMVKFPGTGQVPSLHP